ncbi:MAG: PepSY domain-containing protein, partial [Clostridia bacterium]|nr:PepSY domain-containing protein [Clostridia bacterium]
MNDKDFNKKINEAFEHATPDIPASALFTEQPKKGEVLMMKEGMKKRRITAIVSIAAAFLLVIGLGLGLFVQRAHAEAYTVSLDVNPSIELKVNKAGKVLDANAINEDGKTVLGTMEEKLEGVHVEVAVHALVGSMVQNGYITDVSNSILVSVNSKYTQDSTELTDKLSKELNALFEGSAFEGAVLTQNVTANSELKTLAEQYGISLGKARFIYQIITQNARYTFEELVDLSINELNLLRGVQLEGVDVSGTASDKEYIGTDSAKEAALAHAGVSAEQISKYEIEMGYEKGVMVYEVEFNYDGYEYEYDINAQTGQIVKSEKDKESGRTPNNDTSSESTTLIGEDAAKRAALSHAGITADAADYITCKIDRDDGQVLYEIEFSADGYEYDYDINVTTGAVLKYDKEKDDDGENNVTDNTTGTVIDRAQAKQIALAHAGLTDARITCSLDSENGVKVYELEFTYGGYEYEYDINAANG